MNNNIAKIISFFIPNKKNKRHFLIKHGNNYLEEENKIIKNNYKKVLKKLQNKYKNKEKIKVGFLVSERQKWNCQSIYDKMIKSKEFEPIVLLTSLNGLNKKEKNKELKLNADFFDKLNIKYNLVYRNSKYLKINDIDILFYQQPWEVSFIQDTISTSKNSLTFYIPYSIIQYDTPQELSSGIMIKECKNFLINIFKITTITKTYGDNVLKKISNKIEYISTGHPKLDVYYNDNKKYENKYIIYAPHHSFSGLGFATFQWNGKFILDFAKQYKELNWIFKPHPNFKRAIINANIMTEKEVDNYFKEWEKIGQVYNSGNYFDLFKNSKCLITDCGSFLVEYFPTKKPVIFLNSGTERNKTLTQDIVKTYYDSKNIEELKKNLNDVVLNNNDYMKEKRLNLLEKNKDIFNQDASQNIINYIKDILNEK